MVKIKLIPYTVLKINRGGEGSGNFGHAGRPGKIGGSSSNGSTSRPVGFRNNWKEYKDSILDTKLPVSQTLIGDYQIIGISAEYDKYVPKFIASAKSKYEISRQLSEEEIIDVLKDTRLYGNNDSYRHLVGNLSESAKVQLGKEVLSSMQKFPDQYSNKESDYDSYPEEVMEIIFSKKSYIPLDEKYAKESLRDSLFEVHRKNREILTAIGFTGSNTTREELYNFSQDFLLGKMNL